MPKLIVEIDLKRDVTAQDLTSEKWQGSFEDGRRLGTIAIDEAELERDWEDDSFFVFRLLSIVE